MAGEFNGDGRSAIEGGAVLVPFPGQEEAVKIRATPFVPRPPETLPRQQFLYGYELQRGHLSALIAPGAAGKSTYLMARALCMVTGVERFRQRVWNGPHRVWLWNLEDKRLHLERMYSAFALHYGVQPQDLGERLFLDSAVRNAPGEGDYSPQILRLAGRTEEGGFAIYTPNVKALIAELKARQIDHLDIDPFVSSHGVPENDNGMIDEVAKKWAEIAAEANCSISLAHHIKKIEGREATVLDARGASSLINACRSALVINKMDGEQADACGVPRRERRSYISMADGKNNRAPPAGQLDWFKLVGVGLGNADIGCPGPEDQVATLTRFVPPSVWGGFSAKQLRWVQEQIEAAGPEECRAHSASPKWVGFVVADLLDIPLERGPNRAVAKCEGKVKLVTMLAAWLENDIIRIEDRMVGKSEVKPCVVRGRFIDPAEE
jgi:hypothetical protein